jgi:hypothetical protein
MAEDLFRLAPPKQTAIWSTSGSRSGTIDLCATAGIVGADGDITKRQRQ